MPYNYNLIRQSVINQVLAKLDHQSRWDYHLVPVRNYCLELGEKKQADLQVLELAAYLHDFTRMTGDKARHHLSSAIVARKILEPLNFPPEKIIQVENCIKHHRGSSQTKRITIEEKVLTTADAMAHILHPLPIFYCVYAATEKNLNFEMGNKWIKAKLTRSYQKIQFPETKLQLKPNYLSLLSLLK